MRFIVETNYVKHSYSFVFGASDTSKTSAINHVLGIKGEVVKLVVTLPDWTNTVTAIVSMNNEDSKEVFESSSLAQNDDYDITLNRYECIILGQEDEEWKVTLSGVPGGSGGTVTISAYVRK